jgi:hypothetical protein
MFVCERDKIDIVIASLAYYGVGNILGSVNVLNLETSKFTKPLRFFDEEETSEMKEMEIKPVDVEMGLQSSNDLNEEDNRNMEKKIFMEVASQMRVEQVVEQIEV